MAGPRGRRAHDESFAVLGQLVEQSGEPGPFVVPGDAPGYSYLCAIGSVDKVAAGERDASGQLGSLVVKSVAQHLDEDRVAFAHIIGDTGVGAPCHLAGSARVGKCEKPRTGESDIDKGSLNAR